MRSLGLTMQANAPRWTNRLPKRRASTTEVAAQGAMRFVILRPPRQRIPSIHQCYTNSPLWLFYPTPHRTNRTFPTGLFGPNGLPPAKLAGASCLERLH